MSFSISIPKYMEKITVIFLCKMYSFYSYPFDVHNVLKRLKKGMINSTHLLHLNSLNVIMRGVINSTIVLSLNGQEF